MYDRPLTPAQLLPRLAAAPTRIAALTEGLTPAELRAAPGEGEWSATDVLAHLRACADVWGGCIARLLAEDGKPVPGSTMPLYRGPPRMRPVAGSMIAWFVVL